MATPVSDWLRHSQLLLCDRYLEFNETWKEARSKRPLPRLCFSGRLEKQDGHPGFWLAETFSASPLKPMNGIQQNSQTKRRRSDPVLWQKPLHQQKCEKGKVTTQTTPQKSSIKQQLRTDLGRSVGVTTATQLVWLTGLLAHLPTPRNSRVIKRTHI